MDSSPVIEYHNKMFNWGHLLSQNSQQYQACYAPQSGFELDIVVNSEKSNQANQCRYLRPEHRYYCARIFNSRSFLLKYLYSKQSLNMRTTFPKEYIHFCKYCRRHRIVMDVTKLNNIFCKSNFFFICFKINLILICILSIHI